MPRVRRKSREGLPENQPSIKERLTSLEEAHFGEEQRGSVMLRIQALEAHYALQGTGTVPDRLIALETELGTVASMPATAFL